jgi:hypothetical protein
MDEGRGEGGGEAGRRAHGPQKRLVCSTSWWLCCSAAPAFKLQIVTKHQHVLPPTPFPGASASTLAQLAPHAYRCKGVCSTQVALQRRNASGVHTPLHPLAQRSDRQMRRRRGPEASRKGSSGRRQGAALDH